MLILPDTPFDCYHALAMAAVIVAASMLFKMLSGCRLLARTSTAYFMLTLFAACFAFIFSEFAYAALCHARRWLIITVISPPCLLVT